MTKRLYRVVLLAVLVLTAGPFEAPAAPFTPELEADYAYAEQWWGGAQPVGCTTRLTRELKTEEEIEARGRVLRTWSGQVEDGDYKEECRVYIAEGLEACEQREVVVHEYGHLIGLHHNDDPASIMYSGGTHGILCASESQAAADARAYAHRLAAYEERKATFRRALAREARRCRKIKRSRHRRECWRGVREERRGYAQLLASMSRELRSA